MPTPPTGVLENKLLRLEYTTSGSQRILRLFHTACPHNLLAETPDFGWDTATGHFHLVGGHRVWPAPQDDATAVPETMGMDVQVAADSVELRQQPDPVSHLQRTMRICLEADSARVQIEHEIANHSESAVDLSVWAITQLPHGGRAVIPLAEGVLPGKPHAPNRGLHFWPYASMLDPRLQLSDRQVIFEPRSHDSEFKLGLFTPEGWCDYELFDMRLRKTFHSPAGLYADSGCNVEIYCNNLFFELETLGPLTRLVPGQSASHSETWEISAL